MTPFDTVSPVNAESCVDDACPIAAVPAFPLTEATIASLRAFFTANDHHPSDAMWRALRASTEVLERMANGTATPSVYLSSLSAGVGKSQSVQHFVRTLFGSRKHDHVAVLVCVARLEDIEAMAGGLIALGVPREEIACFTANKAFNEKNSGNASNRARVLITTHAMLKSRTTGVAFPDVQEFWCQGLPRAVRVYDEALDPGEGVTVTKYEILALLMKAGRCSLALRDALEALAKGMEAVDCGDTIIVPDLEADYGQALRAMHDECLAEMKARVKSVGAATIEALQFFSGMEVSLRRENHRKEVALDYRETLADGLTPILLLDASGNAKATYELWARERGSLVRLPSGDKRYDHVKVHVWNAGGGASAFQGAACERLLSGIAEVLNARPDQEFLVVHHQEVARKRKFVDAIRPLIDDRRTGKVHFLNWGRHNATNAYRHVENVILAGTLFYADADYEAIARAAMRRPASKGRVAVDDYNAVRKGENAHNILQAMTRGSARRCNGNQAASMDAWIIAHIRSGVHSVLPEIFPGVRVDRWVPTGAPLKGKVKLAVEYILETITNSEDPMNCVVKFKDVRQAIGVKASKDFRNDIRRHEAFVAALAHAGIGEDNVSTSTHPTGFRMITDPFLAYGFTPVEKRIN